MFAIFALVIVVFSVLTVTSRRILRAAVSLLMVLIATAGLYFLLNYQFMAAVQITLYAGGIVVLIIFSILLTSQISHKFERIETKKAIFSALAAVAGAVVVITTILNHSFSADTVAAAEIDMHVIGRSLLETGPDGYVLPFEVISVLLVAAMIGAIVIAKKGSPHKDEPAK
ncbi:MAG: NADH-quinone oxidoreductase subunit J [Bacteroidota bacterium]|nr:NADH-quinone oxidoreductase subunit J [Bacteroidota bacterium]